jgi:hypothetical protein
MAAVSFEPADEVRVALRVIVSDPAHGPDALSSPRVMASLLSDLLPDAPRESGLLGAAAQRDIAGMLREHVSNGLAVDVAVNLAASSFASSTAFTAEACNWVAAELAIALGLTSPPWLPGDGGPTPFAEITPAIQAPEHELPTASVAPRSPEVPGAHLFQVPEDQRPQAQRPPGPVLAPSAVPQPPQDKGWRLATPLPGPYGTRDCPRCGRMLTRAAIGKPHTSPGHLWCPGIPGLHYVNRGGYLQHVTSPGDLQPGNAEADKPDEKPQAVADPAENSAARRLAEVARLHAAGLLTDQEYRDKRQDIIRQL